jgi:amino acid transporter
MTAINLRGMRATANANLVLMIAMMVVILGFMGLAVRWLFHMQGWAGLFSVQPFYDPKTFHWKSIMTGTSLAALTYGGFDGVSTLSEDVENPRRNILLATVIVCLFTGIFGGLQVYLAQRISPGMGNLTNLETAFIDITRIVGGPVLFTAMAVILIIANLGCGLSAVAGVSRLLYGMGRDRVLPAKVFGYLDERRGSPVYNILLVGLFTYIASLCLNYERAAELINFGAFIAFMGVNAAVIRQFYFLRSRVERRMLTDVLLPGAGFLFCLAIWLSLPTQAKLLGCFWFSLGLIWSAIQTRGFRVPPLMVSFEEV